LRGGLHVPVQDAAIAGLSILSSPDTPLEILDPAGRSPVDLSATELVFPKVADGVGSATAFALINPWPEPVNAALLTMSPLDSLLPWSFQGTEIPGELTAVLPPFGSLFVWTVGAGSGGSEGWTRAISTKPLAAYSSLRRTIGQRTSVAAEAGFSTTGLNHLFPFDNRSGSTSLTLMNLDTEKTATVGVLLYDDRGKQLQATFIEIGPRIQQSFFLSSQFPVPSLCKSAWNHQSRLL